MDRPTQLSGTRYASDNFEKLEQQERFLRAVVSHLAETSRDHRLTELLELLQTVTDQKKALYEGFISTYLEPEAPKGK